MIVFHDDVRKGLDTPSIALMKLKLYLDTKEPQLVYWLQTLWNNQQRAITYKELREAIMRGELDEEMLEEWHKDYSRFVVDYVAPMWTAAMHEAAKELETRYPVFSLDLMSDGIRQWNSRRAASFVTRTTDEQKKAIRAVVKRASQMHDMNVDELARAIRPMVGLNHPQAMANMNYYQKMLDSGLSQKKAKERCVRYAARQSRYRGYMIARTELAHAYNHGEDIGVKAAIDKGLMGYTRKTWCTADDERTCEICGGLEGKTIEMDEDFRYEGKNGRLTRINPRLRTKDIGKVPPAHPHCRCTVLYEEIEPPRYEEMFQ